MIDVTICVLNLLFYTGTIFQTPKSKRKMRNNSTLNMTDKGNTIPDVNIPIGSIVELVIFLILLENFFILLTIRAYKKRKVVDLLILSLAGSDFVNALLPLQLLNIKAHFIISPWQQWLCGSFIWATYTLRLAALSTISLMSIEKAVLLFQPLRYYTQLTFSLMRKVVFIAWISSAIIATVPISLTKNQEQNKDVNCHYHPYHFGIEFCIFIETIGMIHFVIVLGSYIAMLVSSKDFRRRQKSMWYSQRSVREYRGANKRKKSCIETQGMLQARQLCRVVGYVVVLYYVTWLPFLVSYNRDTIMRKGIYLIKSWESLASLDFIFGIFSFMYLYFSATFTAAKTCLSCLESQLPSTQGTLKYIKKQIMSSLQFNV